MSNDAERIAKTIEHTVLKPETTPDQIDRLCEEAIEFAFHGVCVNPVHVARAAGRLSRVDSTDRRIPVVVAPVGFPLGANLSSTKADEARRAMGDGATEVDMVAAIGALVAGDVDAVRRDVEAVARVVHDQGGLVKVILETAVLTDGQIEIGCLACANGGADFVKTSTGFHPAGGASVERVRLLSRFAFNRGVGVKAAGGIRDRATVEVMIAAGASRIGTSSGVAIMRGFESSTG